MQINSNNIIHTPSVKNPAKEGAAKENSSATGGHHIELLKEYTADLLSGDGVDISA